MGRGRRTRSGREEGHSCHTTSDQTPIERARNQ
ncbi:hypothetical protein AB205_0077150 [Aquarana catesbeiana]|uniref:Uncharacterized protein n=1 Tax=Aquarana catesbeiana TaxID=8400 RepID=A0A2G9QD58_AQUCT|nr:hypothetical protein AB205_0077150 [Aquarana catesbeiana]